MSFCASCTAESADLAPEDHDGKMVLLCGACREGHPRSGRWTFEGRVDIASGVGSGNRRLGDRSRSRS